jgi:hydrogenase maturation factor HypF (carbamoyltransferase family)
MNKYEKVIYDLLCLELDIDIRPIQELVERATPEKPKKYKVLDSYDCNDVSKSFEMKIVECPNCKEHLYDEIEGWNFVEFPHCIHCGKSLDWSDEE